MDARLGYSHTKKWIFGYKLHLTCTTGKIIVPLIAADVTTANIQDNQMYVTLVETKILPERDLRLYVFMNWV